MTTRHIALTVNSRAESEAPVRISFAGSNFKDLRERVGYVNLPNVHGDSYMEVLLPSVGYQCLLDDETLPEGDLVVNVRRSECNDIFLREKMGRLIGKIRTVNSQLIYYILITLHLSALCLNDVDP